MLKPEIPAAITPAQAETIRPILEPLLGRLRGHTANLPPLAESALTYRLTQEPPEQPR